MQEVQRPLLTPYECQRMPGPQKDEHDRIPAAGDMVIYCAGHPANDQKRQVLHIADFVLGPKPQFRHRVKTTRTGSAEPASFGGRSSNREEDIAFLDNAWANQQVNIVTIVAWAGVGKSTLVNHWLRQMATDHYRSAELIFGWSFYRQGSSGDTLSADEFLDATLTWFGDPISFPGEIKLYLAERRTETNKCEPEYMKIWQLSGNTFQDV